MRRFLCLMILPVFLGSCGGPAMKREAPTPAQSQPVAILIERAIDGPMIGQSLRAPSALVSDHRGDSYLCDEGNNRIIKFDTAMKPVVDRGGFGNQPGLFNRPRAITIDNQLNLWICDAGNRRLVRLDGRLNFVDEIPYSDETDPLKYGEPSGIAVTNYGALWVADLERDRVAAFDNVGQFEKFVGDFGAGGGQLREPEGIATDHDDNFYVCDGGNRRVMVYDQYGSDQQALTDDEMILPVAVLMGRGRTVWVLDKLANRFFCFDAEGRNLVVGGIRLIGPGAEDVVPAGFSRPTDSTMVISDAANARLLLCKLIYK
ncbi:MAG: NHL repeat-containing protein [bacterium]|nr:NHL repeat-containing protein [bacterium]